MAKLVSSVFSSVQLVLLLLICGCALAVDEAELEQIEDLLQETASSIESLLTEVSDLIPADELEQVQDTMRDIVNSIDILLLRVGELTPDQSSRCPADFVYNMEADICFKLYTDLLTRADASTFCQQLGPCGRLVILNTPEKVQLVREHLTAHYGTQNAIVWNGGLQEDDEGQWLWATGQEVTGPWYPGQPDNYAGSQDCLAISRWTGWTDWLMTDQQCSAAIPYICEY